MPLNQDLKSIIAYAESEGVEINFEEFEFQAQNHPDYPSLLAITDTLSFFNIDNGVITVGISEIELLPDRFVALLDTKKSQPCLHFVEKKGDDYFCFKDKIPMVLSIQDLVSRWKHTVLLVEKSEINNDLQIRKKN